MKNFPLIFVIFAFLVSSCRFEPNQEMVDKAIENGKVAREGYQRCLNFVNGWLAVRDSASGLIPTNLTGGIDQWQVCNSGADNYPFMVLTCYMLDKKLYEGVMADMLNAEMLLTSRLGNLSDDYSFSGKGFVKEKPDTNWIIFSNAEYIKDGLVPLNEYIGKSPWQERMIGIADDLGKYADVIKNVENLRGYKAPTEEINGDLLQLLCRIFWLTGDPIYLDRAVKIGEYYMSGERDLSKINYLRIRDHGCEIIGGLSELYFAVNFKMPEKKEQFREPMHKLLDRVLEVGRNEDGLFYNAVNMATGEIADKGVADTWGYVLDAFYTVWLIDKTESYREAIYKSYSQLNAKYKNYAWEGKSHDGYADAIESGINLLNREEDQGLKDWIDSEMRVMWGMQREDGIIGGWHGDGNFARTTIMYNLWKTQGTHVYPWRDDLILGAVKSGDGLVLALSAEEAWEGKLVFDRERHKDILHLPVDYTRLNQFPEWFVAIPDRAYRVHSGTKQFIGEHSGQDLAGGIPVNLKAGQQLVVTVKPL